MRRHWPTTKRCWNPWKSSRVEQWPWSILDHFWCWTPSQWFHRIVSNIILIHLLPGCHQWSSGCQFLEKKNVKTPRWNAAGIRYGQCNHWPFLGECWYMERGPTIKIIFWGTTYHLNYQWVLSLTIESKNSNQNVDAGPSLCLAFAGFGVLHCWNAMLRWSSSSPVGLA